MESSNPVLRRMAPAVSAGTRMSIDDVVVRTVALLLVVAASGAMAWALLPDTGVSLGILLGAAGLGLILGLVISLAHITNPVMITAYAVVEGVVVGVISSYYEAQYPGIVLQAVVATFGVFFAMAALYKFKVIRATPTFAKWVMGALFGVIALMLANFALGIFGVNGGAGLGLRDGSPMSIVFSLVCIGIAALTFVLDFKAIEDGIRRGADTKEAWYASFGILVGLIWLYLETLRLVGFIRR